MDIDRMMADHRARERAKSVKRLARRVWEKRLVFLHGRSKWVLFDWGIPEHELEIAWYKHPGVLTTAGVHERFMNEDIEELMDALGLILAGLGLEYKVSWHSSGAKAYCAYSIDCQETLCVADIEQVPGL